MNPEIVISAKNISKTYHTQYVIKNTNLEVIQGTTIGIVGRNGSGKSLLFKMLVGLVRPDTGEVLVRGLKLGKSSDFPENVGILINSPGFIELYTGLQNLAFLAAINHKIPKDKILVTMEKVGLDPYNRTKVKNYSLGMKQKLGIAQAIMENQDILILDEPFNSLDFQTNKDIKTIIRQLQKEKKTILITSHNFQDIEELCNEIYMIENATLTLFSGELKAEYT